MMFDFCSSDFSAFFQPPSLPSLPPSFPPSLPSLSLLLYEIDKYQTHTCIIIQRWESEQPEEALLDLLYFSSVSTQRPHVLERAVTVFVFGRVFLSALQTHGGAKTVQPPSCTFKYEMRLKIICKHVVWNPSTLTKTLNKPRQLSRTVCVQFIKPVLPQGVLQQSDAHLK